MSQQQQQIIIHLFVLAVISSYLDLVNGLFVDLTLPFGNDTVNYPGFKTSHSVLYEQYDADGQWMAVNGLSLTEHSSTHLDAPYHFYREGKKLDEIPLEDLLDQPAIMLDVYDKVNSIDENGNPVVNKNYAATKEDVLEWERRNGRIPPRSWVLLRTGWSNRWPNAELFLGLDDSYTNVVANQGKEKEELKLGTKVNFPGWDVSAANFLTTERQVVGVGIDTLANDVGESAFHDLPKEKKHPAHVIFAKRGALMVESLTDLHLLPSKGFRLWVVPMKIDRGTGAPTRVFADIPDLTGN